MIHCNQSLVSWPLGPDKVSVFVSVYLSRTFFSLHHQPWHSLSVRRSSIICNVRVHLTDLSGGVFRFEFAFENNITIVNVKILNWSSRLICRLSNLSLSCIYVSLLLIDGCSSQSHDPDEFLWERSRISSDWLFHCWVWSKMVRSGCFSLTVALVLFKNIIVKFLKVYFFLSAFFLRKTRNLQGLTGLAFRRRMCQ